MSGTIMVIAFVLFCLLLALLLKLTRPAASPASLPAATESLLPHHYRYFPQIRQALSAADERYLREKLGPAGARAALRERRNVAKGYLAGLQEDFADLERLGRMVAALSPVLSRKQETERLLLGLKFRVLYAWARLRLSSGPVPLEQIEHLTGLIGTLSRRMEEAMSAIAAASAPGLSRLSA